MIMPAYVKDEKQRKLFDGAKKGDVITFNPKKAYPDNDAEVAALLKVQKDDVRDLDSDFSYQINEIRHFQPAEINQQLFDRVFGEGTGRDQPAAVRPCVWRGNGEGREGFPREDRRDD